MAVRTPPKRPAATTPAGADAPKNAQRKFLKAADLHTDGPTRMVLSAPMRVFTGGQYGDQLIVGCLLDTGQEFDFSLRLGSRNHVAIERKFGKNLLDWPNKEVDVQIGTFADGSQSGTQSYVQVIE